MITGMEITLRPIGWVRNRVQEPRPEGWGSVESVIELEPEMAPALAGLDGFSHIIMLFWMHQIPEELRIAGRHHPGNRQDLPLVGDFATRTQLRPNPIGLAIVPLLQVDGPRLHVRGLDAIDGTPIIDIKPYLPPYDSPKDPRVPSWVWGVNDHAIESQ